MHHWKLRAVDSDVTRVPATIIIPVLPLADADDVDWTPRSAHTSVDRVTCLITISTSMPEAIISVYLQIFVFAVPVDV